MMNLPSLSTGLINGVGSINLLNKKNSLITKIRIKTYGDCLSINIDIELLIHSIGRSEN